MGIFDFILIGASLSMDAFAISLCSGLQMKRVDPRRCGLIAGFFAGFQALMPCLGWALGRFFAEALDRFDHYIAFAVLAFLGLKMLRDALRGGDAEGAAGLSLTQLFAMAAATSVDTLAVGVTFGMDPSVNISVAALCIGAVTFAICVLGVLVGSAFGARWQKKAQLLGGAMLVLVGLKILLEGLFSA